LHFNRRRDNSFEEYFPDVNKNNNFLAVDTLKIDEHMRLRFTKRTRSILPIQAGDELAVFQNKEDNMIIFNLQRKGRIVDVWILGRISEDEKYDYRINQSQIQSILNTNSKLQKIEGPHQIPKNYKLMDIPEREDHIQNSLNPMHRIASSSSESATGLDPNRPVMIVDDESDILLSFSEMLRKNGIKSESFTKSADALLRFTEADPSYFGLVILDIRMPEINGLQLYKLMKAQRKDTSFFFVSAVDYADEFMRMLPDTDAKNFLTKPVDENTFIKKVRDLL
jgi:CheY-like chemotaxis protein